MTFVVMNERHCRIHHRSLAVRIRHDSDVVPFYHLHEAFCYFVDLRAAHHCCAWLKIQLSDELRTSAFHVQYTLNHYPSATAPVCPVTCTRR